MRKNYRPIHSYVYTIIKIWVYKLYTYIAIGSRLSVYLDSKATKLLSNVLTKPLGFFIIPIEFCNLKSIKIIIIILLLLYYLYMKMQILLTFYYHSIAIYQNVNIISICLREHIPIHRPTVALPLKDFGAH